ncbi:MAG: biopolymer transporter ExbD [Kiritimatiellae bacterium]|nr:biopolymer transporter ExbD [Kiritimatiellia bacterium]
MLYRKQTGRYAGMEAVEIPLSPLIDCVFLLLIFFLVTSMLKRKETIIPIVLPDATSSLSAEAAEEVLVIGLGPEGEFLNPTATNRFGALSFSPGGSLDAHLDRLLATHGPSIRDQAIRFDIVGETPFQKTIDALDLCKLRGFTNVGIRLLAPFGD